MTITTFLSRQSLRTIFLGAALLPMAAAVAFAIILIRAEAREMLETRQLGELMQLVDALGDLVHEQQKERGATSIFLSSKGAEFGPQLAAQREATDAASATLTGLIGKLDLATSDPDLSGQTAAILAKLQARPEIRDQVDAQTIPVPDAIGFYTAGNTIMLDQISRIGGRSSDSGVTASLGSFVAFLAAKERAGVERAVASGGFALGRFDLARLLVLQRLIAQQEMGFEFFLSNAPAPDRAAFEAMRALPETRAVWTYRDLAFAFPRTADLSGITGTDFFNASTVRINAMKDLEEQMSAEIAAMVGSLYRASFRSLCVALALLGILILGMSMALRAMLRCILEMLSGIAEAADRMSNGELKTALPTQTPRELGAIVVALDRFRTSIIEGRDLVAREARAKAAAEQRAADQKEEQRLYELRQEEAAAARRAERADRDKRNAEEIALVVNACARGDFSQRLGLDGKEGAIAEICAGVNRIGEVADRGLAEIRAALERIADGDLTHRMDDSLSGVFAEIGGVMARTIGNLGQTLARVSASAVTVNGSARELSTATDDLARRSERNAAMLEQTAASLNQMSSSIGTASEAAVSARQSVGTMSSRAEQGNEVVQGTIAQMEEISRAAESIEKVLGVIDDIAFQTNLLALNAGVEAARAGEAGRGFAVVASEVRALAQRSSESAREIADMMARSSESVRRGVEMAANSGEALRHIVGDIGEVSGAIDRIAATFQEAKLGISEISEATTQIDRTTQQNAAMFEETNAAIHTLETEARRLSEEMGAFKVDPDTASEHISAPAANVA
ncbi:methyl-accepting chemotaxis protein [Mangrovicoccus algicola]|uniref:Methyl-accepting chemotaxis protein n=1 Tax=Mangrovicoccus algicola TaxID=2771008 RepID=A0A8J6Z056_9RHOB|nr:nitrate- and nitrite sensing domain-containing protein [Mangrovicoccus algicola]MBE3639113.1 methyl-accepting chemotaxis protein [Mangrovicoccus algicola]